MKAVVLVDVQKDFIDGALKNEAAMAAVPKIVEFAKQCVYDDECEIYVTRDTHQKTIWETKTEIVTCDGGKQEKEFAKIVGGYATTLEGKKLPVEHCIEGTDGWMVDNRLLDALHVGYSGEEQPMFACTFVNKPTFGSFDLVNVIAEDFESKKLDEIVLCGFCTDICVVSNALLLRAKFPNTKITVMKDLCAGVTLEAHEAALKVMTSCQIDVV